MRDIALHPKQDFLKALWILQAVPSKEAKHQPEGFKGCPLAFLQVLSCSTPRVKASKNEGNVVLPHSLASFPLQAWLL